MFLQFRTVLFLPDHQLLFRFYWWFHCQYFSNKSRSSTVDGKHSSFKKLSFHSHRLKRHIFHELLSNRSQPSHSWCILQEVALVYQIKKNHQLFPYPHNLLSLHFRLNVNFHYSNQMMLNHHYTFGSCCSPKNGARMRMKTNKNQSHHQNNCLKGGYIIWDWF